jgi:YgiT-type zinc finger domain-containing protein
MSKTDPCPFCGNIEFVERNVEYLYSRNDHYLFVPDMPAFVCLNCGERYYKGDALIKVEQRFKAIYQREEQPDRYLQMPVMEFEHDS